ncbi:MAG: hypothetical protein KA508_00555 [Gammaproteobacteria bacterium]|nr:hypothetical protein [Gammaproteobacteria bacterium]
MSDNGDIVFTPVKATSEAMADRLKKLNGSLGELEFSGAEVPIRDPSDKTPVLPLTPQKAAEEATPPIANPKSASGVAGTRPINNEAEWNKMVECVSAHLEAQGYKVDLELSGEMHGQASFSSKQTPPEGTLSMTRDKQS